MRRNGKQPGEKFNSLGQPDLNRLVVFQTLVNEGTMSRASDRLFISQPAISAHIKALELAMGVSLFNREGRRSVVNPAGQILYVQAERLLSVADELQTTMEDLRGKSVGRLRLGASFVWLYHLPRALTSYKRRFPHVELSVETANSDRIERLVLDRSVDIGFIARESTRRELVSRRVADDVVVAVCAPTGPLANSPAVGPREIQSQPLAIREAGSATRRATDELLGTQGVAPNVSMELGSQEAIEQAAADGYGVGMVCRAGAQVRLRAGMLVALGAPVLSSPLELHVIHRDRKRLTSIQKAFLQSIDKLSPRLILNRS